MFIVVLLVLFVAPIYIDAQTQNISLSGPELMSLVQNGFKLIDPSLEANHYFTPFMKEKIAWFKSQMDANVIEVIVDAPTVNANNQVAIMETTWEPNGKPKVTIHGTRVWYMKNIQDRLAPLDFFKTAFALAVVHEAVHLERRPIGTQPDSLIAEEMRTWRKVDLLAVRPLRKAGIALDPDHIRVDNALKACGDREKCPQLRMNLLGENKVLLKQGGRP